MTQQKVAIIEDDIAIVQMYRMKFQNEGYDVETAGDGEAGLELIKSVKPDIVLLDLMMPKMTGDKMLEQLRKQAWGKDVRVIILTNMGESEAPKSVRENGVKQFIVKSNMTPRDVADIVKAELAQ